MLSLPFDYISSQGETVDISLLIKDKGQHIKVWPSLTWEFWSNRATMSLKHAENFGSEKGEKEATPASTICAKSQKVCFRVAVSYPPQFPQLFRFTGG